LSPSTRPIQPPFESDLKTPETSLPPRVTAGALVAPRILTSASPPLTSSGREERISTVRPLGACAQAGNAASAPQMATHGATRRRLCLFMRTSLGLIDNLIVAQYLTALGPLLTPS